MWIRNRKRLRIGVIFVLLGLVAASVAGLRLSIASSNDWTSYAVMDWYRNQPVDPGFTIRTAAELAGVAVLVNSGEANGFADKTLMISNNINLADHDWVPIGTQEHPFRGTLFTTGGNVRIDGLKLNGSFSHVGLFGKAVDASIGGLTIGNSGAYNVTVTKNVYAGSVIGQIEGRTEVHHIINELDILVTSGSHNAYVGGIVGFGEYKISHSANNADIHVEGNASVGGILGVSSANGLELKKVDNHGRVLASGNGVFNTHVGGIAGVVMGSLAMGNDDTAILNTGEIRALNGQLNFAGGIIGKLAGRTIQYSENTVNAGAVIITAPNGQGSSAGGLIGAITAPQSNAVPIIFRNTGSVTSQGGQEVHTGGVVGLLQAEWTWSGDMYNDAMISATGIKNIIASRN
jgi:fibronectin-binding autotransporter adhesin